MRDAIRARESKGLRGMALTSKSPNLRLRNIQVHLQEPQYDSFFEAAKPAFRRANIRVERVDVPEAPEVVDEETPEEEPEVVVDEAPEEEPEVENEDTTEPQKPLTAADRQSKSRDADIYVEVSNKDAKPSTDQLASLAESVKDKGNRIKVFGLSVSDLPPANEIQFDIVGEKIEDFSNVRAIAADSRGLVLEAIAEGIPVVDLEPSEDLEGFTVSDLDEVATARVANTEARQEFLGSL